MRRRPCSLKTEVPPLRGWPTPRGRPSIQTRPVREGGRGAPSFHRSGSRRRCSRCATATSGPLPTIAVEIIGPVCGKLFVQALGGDHVRIVKEPGPGNLARPLFRSGEALEDELPDHFGKTRVPPPSLPIHQLGKVVRESDRRTLHTRILAYARVENPLLRAEPSPNLLPPLPEDGREAGRGGARGGEGPRRARRFSSPLETSPRGIPGSSGIPAGLLPC
jgi:hypothetical protein